MSEALVKGDQKSTRASLRPSFPFMLIAMAAFFSTLLFVEGMFWTSYHDGLEGPDVLRILLPAVSLLPLAFVVSRLPTTVRSSAATLLLSVACAYLSGAAYWGWWASGVQRLGTLPGGEHVFLVCGDAQQGSYGAYSNGALILDDGSRYPLRLYWPVGIEPLPCGMRFSAYGEIRTPACDDLGHRQHREGSFGSVRLRAVTTGTWRSGPQGLSGRMRQRMRGIIVQDGVDGGGWRSDGAALLLGIDLGDRSLIRQSDLQQDFRICGLSHMLAVSGTHLVIVAALMSWAFEKMRMGKGVKAVLLSFALITYVFLSGLQTSAIRSCIMAITGTFAERAKRRRDPLSSCALTIMLLLGQDPSTAFDFSFRLSVCAVLGIICFSRYLEAWILCLTPKSMQGLANPLAVTLAAQGATMPLIVSGFSCLPLLSPVSNLIIAPLLSVTLGASLIMLPICLIIPSMQSVLMALPLFLGGLIARIASLLALIPNSNLPICCDQGTALLCMTILSATLWFFWPQPSRRRAQWASVTICSAALALACVPILPLSPRMIVLDVGQGDAILIRDGRRTVLIDAGPMDDALLKALARQHVRHIDCLIITHPHEDHYGGIVRLRGAVTIDELIMPGPMLDRDFPAYDVILPLFDDDRIHPMHVGQRLKLKHMEITMLGPSELTDEGDNQDSLILFVDVDADSDGTGDAQVLLTGDAEAETLERPEHAYDLSCVDVFKLGHHGSAVSIDRDTLREMDPHCVLISVGRDNDYGHPDPNVLSLLEDAGVTVGRTDMMGDLTVTFASASVSLRCDTMGP